MLYLKPPFHMINGVSIFRDHADKEQYYYLPLAPKLTQIKDSSTGALVPQIQVINYRGSAGNGGFLSFDVNIGVEEDVLDDISRELQRLENLRNPPRLAPVPLVDGTVKMMMFGQQTSDSTAAGTDSPTVPETSPKFVLKINQHAKPALYGNNQAAFSVQLDPEGVTILEKALQGEIAPIGIVYSLEYLALRPAYSVRVSADWDRVQTHLQEQFGVKTFFASAEIDRVVDELIEDQVISIEVDTFVPEGEEASEMLSRRDQAVNELKDMVLKNFFEPTLDPVDTNVEEDGWDKAAKLFARASAISSSAGASELGGRFTYRKSDLTRIDKKSLNAVMNERTTVRRSLYPQGHLGGLFKVLSQPGLDIDRFVLSVDTDSPWYQRRRVDVISRADFESDAIASINVKLTYGNRPQNLILESTNPRASLEWASLLEADDMVREVSTRYSVSFQGADRTERPITLTSPTTITQFENLEINPRELYSILHVPIISLNFPWERYPHVEVQTRYWDEENEIRIEDGFMLSSDRSEETWKVFLLDPSKTQYQYKLIYRAADHKDIEMPWIETDDERIRLTDPYPNKRVLSVVPSFNWEEISMVFVDLSYRDPDNQLRHDQSMVFSAAEPGIQNFQVGLINSDRRKVGYRITVLFKNGSVVEIPPSFTFENRIIVRSDMKGHIIVRLSPEDGDFATHQLKKMTVELQYEDEQAGLSYTDLYTFDASDQAAYFEFDYVDTQHIQYQYRIKRQFTNGLSTTTEWAKDRTETLVLPLR